MFDRILVTTVVLSLVTGAALAQQPSVRIRETGAGDIRMDGRLDDPEWASVPSLPLTQQSPHSGAPSPYMTTVRVAADRARIYFGFTCSDPAPEQIGVHTMQRDGDMSGDDTIAIVLDTFGDRRSGYYVRINTAGARDDGLVATPESVPLDWDGVWDARVAQTPDGWTAEIAIPVNTLRFDPSRESWGFNAERYVPRERQTLRWTSTTLDARLADFRRSGLLAVPRFQQGLGLTVNVNTIAKRTADFSSNDRAISGRTGVDVGYNATPQLGGVVTVNTDFAETEVDTRQINLTQFPLFVPEKLAFFLEGSNQFKFRLTLRSHFVPF